MLAAARRQIAACEIEIAAQIVNLGEARIIAQCVRERLRFGKRQEGIVDLGDQPIGRRAPQQGAATIRGVFGDPERPEIGFQCIATSPRILMQVAEQNGQVERIAFVGRHRQAAYRKRDGLILAEEARLRLGGYEIGVGCFAIACAVEMFGPQHRIIDKDRGGGTVEFSSPRVGE